MIDSILYEHAEKIIEMWQESMEYQNVVDSLKRLYGDPNTKRLIQHFVTTRDHYNELQAYGTHHPDLPRVAKAFSEAKAQLYQHPFYQSYIHALNHFNQGPQAFQKRLRSCLDSCLVREKHHCVGGESHGSS
jgi:cell fate (sporulation/competence/biofilm development) regulator YlbF (YheA/YmcA/DUF963 family)